MSTENNEKNINLVLQQNEPEDENNITISFGTIFKQLKKIFSLWIVLAIISGIITASVVLIASKTVSDNEIKSLINFSYSGIENGLDPNGEPFDVNKIKSPNIIETALTTLDIPISSVESVRRNITIDGIIPNEDLDKLSIYKDIYQQGGSAGLDAANSLLDVGYNPSYYIIKLNCLAAGFDIDTGKKIIDEILVAYQDYFFTTYGYNEALGNSISSLDYKDYDYPAAVDIFRSTLDDLDQYLRKIESNDASSYFRSTKTGFSIEDLRRNINTIKDIDLDSISSYITINNITNDSAQLTTYYEYKIEECERDLKVSESELKSITDSINSYEKDTMMIFGDISESENSTKITQVSEKYDELIERKVSVQEECSTKKQRIEYYKSRIKNLDNKNVKVQANIEYAEQKLEELYNKVNNLIDITIDTSDEYYENVVFANAFNILVPAAGGESTVEMNRLLYPVIIIEGVLLVIYLGYSIISAIVIENRNRKEQEQTLKAE